MAIREYLEEVVLDGYSGEQLIIQFYNKLLVNDEIGDLSKARILEKCAEADRCMREGSREDLQLQNLFVSAITIL